MSGLHILWFRQDLRVHDHAPLKAACLAADRDGGRILPLFVFGKGAQASQFLVESLRDLEAALDQRAAALHFRQGDPVSVLSDLHRAHNVLSLYVHETSSVIAEDRAVEAWCLRAGIALRAYPQFGPEQMTGKTNNSQRGWDEFMASPRHEAPPEFRSADVGVGHRPSRAPSSVESAMADQGGRKAAIEVLRGMLGRVSELGQVGADDPLRSENYFEQILPYLELGSLSIRETWQAAVTARNQYLAAGQDIRAMRVTELIQKLPSFYWARVGSFSGASVASSIERARHDVSTDGQLSLDLDHTGTG